MRTIARAGLTTATLIGIVAGPVLTSTAHATPEIAKERGIVLECSGTLRGQAVHASIYENDTYGNVLAITIGDPERGGAVGSRDTKASLWAGRRVEAGVKVAGRPATVIGPAQPVGGKRPVHDDFDDAGHHIVVDGHHRRLRTDLVLTYGRHTAPLTCDSAFLYDLTVTKENLV